MNWETIQYIFQIPLSWYRKIHDRVFKAYGEDFIHIKEDGENGGLVVGVDEDTFSQRVLEITEGGSGGGTVQAVDGIPPDAQGNVQLGAVRSINNVQPDANGNIDSVVTSIDGVQPDANGNLNGVVFSVNDTAPDANGNVTLDISELVDDVVSISANQWITGMKTFDNAVRLTIDGYRDDATRAAYSSRELDFIDESYKNTGVIRQEFNTNGSNIFIVRTNKANGADISSSQLVLAAYPSGYTKATLQADNVQFGDFDNGLQFTKQNANIELWPKADSNYGGIIDFHLNGAQENFTSRLVENTAGFQMLTYDKALIFQSGTDKDISLRASPNHAVLLNAPTVLSSDNNSKAIATCGWVNSNRLKIGTTSDTAAAGNHTHNYNDKFVTLDTSQTITGQKTFKNNIFGEGSLKISDPTLPERYTYYGNSYIYLHHETAPQIRLYNGTSQANIINNSQTDRLFISHPSQIAFDAPILVATYGTTDTDSTTAKTIATTGWCNTKFGKVKTVNGVSPVDGNVQLDVVETVNGVSPVEGNVQLDVVETVNGVSPVNGNVNVGTVKKVDNVSPDENGNVPLGAVTLNGQQTITGRKTFDSQMIIGTGHELLFRTATDSTQSGYQYQTFRTSDNFATAQIAAGTTAEGYHRLQVFAYNNINGSKSSGVQFYAHNDVNKQVLIGEPDRLYSTGDNEQIASRGYVRLNFAKALHSHGNITSDGKITQSLTPSTTINSIVAVASDGSLWKANITDVAPAINITTQNITDWNSATENFATNSDLDAYATKDELNAYATKDDLDNYASIDDLNSYATKDELNDYATKSDLDSCVKTSDLPNGFLASAAQGITNNLTMVTDVQWNGTQLVKKSITLNINNGLITGASGETTSVVDTPTVVTWG